MGKSDFTFSQHFELGLWVRNNWLYNPACKLADSFGGFVDDDDKSMKVLEALYDLLAEKRS